MFDITLSVKKKIRLDNNIVTNAHLLIEIIDSQ